MSELMEAIQNNDIQEVKQLINYGIDLALREDNCTPLMYAAEKNHIEIVRLLIDAGVDLEAKNTNGCTASMLADLEEHTEIVELLETKRKQNVRTNKSSKGK